MKLFIQSPKWGETTVLRQSIGFTGVCKNARWTPFPEDDCDWLLCSDISKLPAKIKSLPKKKRIFIMQENPKIWRPSHEFLSQYGTVISPFVFDVPHGVNFIQGQPAVAWFYGIKFDTNCGLIHKPLGGALELGELKKSVSVHKTKLLSTITSSKAYLPGHQWRIQITNALQKEFGNAIDIYGFGHKPIGDKSEALDKYKFSIVIENDSSPHYWTEKLSDCLIAKTIPIYSGASLASHYLNLQIPSIPFGCDPDKAVSIIKDHISKCTISLTDLELARNKILDEYNMLEYVPYLVSSVKCQN